MLAGDKRIAYYRCPAHLVLWSENPSYRGKFCGQLETLALKVISVSSKDTFRVVKHCMLFVYVVYSNVVITFTWVVSHPVIYYMKSLHLYHSLVSLLRVISHPVIIHTESLHLLSHSCITWVISRPVIIHPEFLYPSSHSLLLIFGFTNVFDNIKWNKRLCLFSRSILNHKLS